MTDSIGTRIANERRYAGLTQEELVGLIGEQNISLSTLKRIEHDEGRISLSNAMMICKALDLSVSDIVDDKADLRYALASWFNEPDDDTKSEVQYRMNCQRVFYPEVEKSILFDNKPIKTLLQFLVYLPLMDDLQVLYSLRRLAGSVYEQEYYVMEQLSSLYQGIPESNAKRYADYSAKKATFEYFKGILLSDESVEAEDLEIIENPERWDEFDSGYQEYLRVIETKIQKVEEVYKLAANYPDDREHEQRMIKDWNMEHSND